jgi:hypothetical protein
MLESADIGENSGHSIGDLVCFIDLNKEFVFCRIYEEFEEPTTKLKEFTFKILHPYRVEDPISGELVSLTTGRLPSYVLKKVNEA